MKQRIGRVRDLGEIERLKGIVEGVEHTEVSDFEAWNEVRADGVFVQRCEFKCDEVEKWWNGWYMVDVCEGKWIARGRIVK